jgi:hypothetical protein
MALGPHSGVGQVEDNIEPQETKSFREEHYLPRIKKPPSPSAEVLAKFRNELMCIYERFEEDLITVTRKYGFEINMWYSPSKIPQPNFKAGRLLLDMDEIYDQRGFSEKGIESITRENSHRGRDGSANDATPFDRDAPRKTVELRDTRPSMLNGLLDFRHDVSDLRVKRSSPRRGTMF